MSSRQKNRCDYYQGVKIEDGWLAVINARGGDLSVSIRGAKSKADVQKQAREYATQLGIKIDIWNHMK